MSIKYTSHFGFDMKKLKYKGEENSATRGIWIIFS